MKEILLRYAEYNMWAHQAMLDVLLTLPPKQLEKEVKSSFNSVYKTYLHIYHAEIIWWQRIQQHDPVTIHPRDLKPTVRELTDGILSQNILWKDWIVKQSEANLQSFFAYKNMKGERFTQPFWEILHNLFNHATFHRGQVVTQLRQLGVSNIPATDFAHWARG